MINSQGKPFVVLRGLAQGNVFWSCSQLGEDPTKLTDGTVAYEVIGYCDTDTDAKELYDKHVDPNALSNYIRDSFLHMGYTKESANEETDRLVGLFDRAEAH